MFCNIFYFLDKKNILHSHASYLVDNIILTKNRTNLQNNVDCRQQLFKYKYTNKIDKNKGIAYFLKQAISKRFTKQLVSSYIILVQLVANE